MHFIIRDDEDSSISHCKKIAIMTVLVLMTLATLVDGSLLGYDCASLKNVPVAVDITGVKHCVPDMEKNITTTEEEIQIIQVKEIVKIGVKS